MTLGQGQDSDRCSPLPGQVLPPQTLLLRDLGYFSVPAWRRLDNQNVFFLTRLQVRTAVVSPQGERLALTDLLREACSWPGGTLDRQVLLGSAGRPPVRLVAVRVPPQVAQVRRVRPTEQARTKGRPVSQPALTLADGTVLVTNAGLDVLGAEEALLLLAVRWQIELLFKRWKQPGQVDEWRTQNPERILSEVYTKLIGVAPQHWATAVGCWARHGQSGSGGPQLCGHAGPRAG